MLRRAITGITLGLAVIIGILYLPLLGFDLLALLVITLAAWEYSGFFSEWNYAIRVGFLVFLVLSLLFSYMLPTLPILITGTLWWIASPYFLWRYSENKSNYFTDFIRQILLGLVIFIPCWIGLVAIRRIFGIEYIFFLLIAVWGVDIGAYFAGTFFGKRLLAPKISPKKTIEGVFGGVLVAFLFAIGGILWLKFYPLGSEGVKIDFSVFRIISLLILVLVSCLWTVVGDLFESMLKRQAGVKDSGRLLPGHGGMYDRIDSLLAVVPIYSLGLFLI